MKNIIPPALFLGLALLLPVAARAQQGRALDRLPAETVGAVVFPDSSKWMDTMAKTTRLGQLMNDPNRWAAVSYAMKEGMGKDRMETLQAKLTELNLKPEDLHQIMRHDFGAAVVILKKSAGEPLPVVLFWAGCGQPLAEKLKSAALDPKLLGAGANAKATRSDINEKLTRLVTGSFVITPTAEDEVPGPVKYSAKPGLIYVGADHGYFIGAFTAPGSAANDADFVANEELITPVVAAFVEAQKNTGQGVFTRRVLQPADIRAALDKAGEGLLAEVLLDVPALVKVLHDSVAAKVGQAEKMIVGLGLDGAGPLVMVIGSQSQRLTSELVWSCPAPRRGLLRLLDQKNSAPEVPDWVGSDVIQYARYNFSLSGAMDIIVDSVKAAAPTDKDAAKIDQGLAQGNGFLGSMLGGLTVRDFLAGFGDTQQLVTYLPSLSTDEALATPQAGPFAQFSQANLALVWTEANPDVWRKVMNAINQFMSSPKAPFYRLDEQGYSGWLSRPTATPAITSGLFLGKEALLLSLGRDVHHKVISGLVAPGKHNTLLEDSRGVMTLRDGWAHTYGDLRPQLKNMRGQFNAAMGQARFENEEERRGARILVEAIKQASLTDAEVDESFGMVVGQTWTDETGLHSESALMLQPAK